MTERLVIDTIRTITNETGYPPDADELAAALNSTPKAVLSAIMYAKRDGKVQYTEDGRLALT